MEEGGSHEVDKNWRRIVGPGKKGGRSKESKNSTLSEGITTESNLVWKGGCIRKLKHRSESMQQN